MKTNFRDKLYFNIKMSNLNTPTYHVAMDAETYLTVVSMFKRKEETRIKAREKYRLEHEAKMVEPKPPKAYKAKTTKFIVTKVDYEEPYPELSAKLENIKLSESVAI